MGRAGVYPRVTIANQTVLTTILLGLGVYFLVLLIRGLLAFARFSRIHKTALVTWPVARTRQHSLFIALGALSLFVALLNAFVGRPVYHVGAQAIMALYFLLMVPLSLRIELGFYRDGVWADAGFLPYEKIGRLAFRETPEIVLTLLPRGGGSTSFQLRVPPEEYGAVRKVLQQKISAHVVNVEGNLLGLS